MKGRHFLIGGGVALAGAGATYVGVRRMGSMEDAAPDIVMRFGYGPTLPYSARRPPVTVG